jgi:exonuclease III
LQISHNVRIITWNANSVTNKKADLALFLNVNNIDIAAIGETKLSPKSRFSIPGYTTYRADRNQFGGGVMILIKHNLRHDQFDLPNLAGLEASAVYPYPPQNRELLFVSAYLPPSSALSATDALKDSSSET